LRLQQLVIEGQYITIHINSNFSKKFNEAELLLMASQMLKAYSAKTLKHDIAKITEYFKGFV